MTTSLSFRTPWGHTRHADIDDIISRIRSCQSVTDALVGALARPGEKWPEKWSWAVIDGPVLAHTTPHGPVVGRGANVIAMTQASRCHAALQIMAERGLTYREADSLIAQAASAAEAMATANRTALLGYLSTEEGWREYVAGPQGSRCYTPLPEELRQQSHWAAWSEEQRRKYWNCSIAGLLAVDQVNAIALAHGLPSWDEGMEPCYVI